jgi:hypothetical protein
MFSLIPIMIKRNPMVMIEVRLMLRSVLCSELQVYGSGETICRVLSRLVHRVAGATILTSVL